MNRATVNDPAPVYPTSMPWRTALGIGAVAVALAVWLGPCQTTPETPEPDPAYLVADSTLRAEADSAVTRQLDRTEDSLRFDSLADALDAEIDALLAQIRAERAAFSSTLDALSRDVHSLPPDSLARRARVALRERTGR